jgi:tyrosyl-tRNA synthetase
MSKSLDNYISLEDSSTDMFGKMMSISDDLMIRYYELLSRRKATDVATVVSGLKDGSYHPMNAKKELAAEIVEHYHGEGSGQLERDKFEARFSKNKIPDDILTVEKEAGELDVLAFLTEIEFIKSNGEGRRLMKQNAFKVDFKASNAEKLQIESSKEYILKLGKLRIVKVIGK